MKKLVCTLELQFEDSAVTGEVQKSLLDHLSRIPGIKACKHFIQPEYMPLMSPGIMGYKALGIQMSALSEEQAANNHSQSLTRIAERGGLDPSEALALVRVQPWKPIPLTEALLGLYLCKDDQHANR